MKGLKLLVVGVLEACAPVPRSAVVRPSAAPTSVASAAPSATAAPSASAAPPPSTPCEHLEAHSARALREDRERGRRSIESLVRRGADPLAPQRADAFTEVNRLRGAGDREGAARAEIALTALQRRHIEQQIPDQIGMERAVTTNVMRFFLSDDSASCWPAGSGAWGIVLDEVHSFPNTIDSWHEPWAVSARVVLAYSDASGAIQTAPVTTFSNPSGMVEGWPEPEMQNPNCCDHWGAALLEPELFDFDGDGSPEIFVHGQLGHEGSHEEWAELYTVRGGRLQPYPFTRIATMPLTGMEDLNNDGRPDPFSFALYSGGMACGSGFPITAMGPKFPAIAEADGRLDFTSAAALAYARTWCPRAPANPSTVEEVVCARLWGQREAVLRRSLERRYDPWDCDAVDNGRPQPSRRAHEDYESLLGALDVPLPFRLTR